MPTMICRTCGRPLCLVDGYTDLYMHTATRDSYCFPNADGTHNHNGTADIDLYELYSR